MRTANDYYRETFGCKVYKLSLDGGFTCPNRDGTLGTGGCAFCSGSGSGEFAQSACGDIRQQLELAKKRVEAKCKTGKYIAYFQSFTGTYAPLSRLEALFTGAMEPEYIVGLSVATRPDCLPEEVIALLARLSLQKPVSIELGLPGETEEDMLNSTRLAVDSGTDGVKFHLLHVLQGTALEEWYRRGEFRCLTMEEYGSILCKCIALLPPETVVHRITGDGARRELIAPSWSLDKKRVLNYLSSLLRTTGQGKEKRL